MFVWLGIALIIDGVDGTFARRLRVAELLPRWSGDVLDLVVDILDLRVRAGLCASPPAGCCRRLWPFRSASLIVVTGSLYFADRQMKTSDYYFRGFPALWNVAAFYLFLLKLPPWLGALRDRGACGADLRAVPRRSSDPHRASARALRSSRSSPWALLAVFAVVEDLAPGFWALRRCARWQSTSSASVSCAAIIRDKAQIKEFTMTRPVLLIAGGSRGIGAATARLAAARGYDVAINYLNRADAAAEVAGAVKKSGGTGIAIQGDMAKEADIVRVFDETTRALGPITHFVHSAGIGGKNSRLDAASADTIREVIDVNLFGALICSREAVRRMSTAHGGKGGSIVLLSSIAAVTGGATEYVFYAAAKGGVDALTNGLAREVANGGRARQRHPARPDRYRNSRARPARPHHAAIADEAPRRAERDRRGGAVPVVGRCLVHHGRRAQRLGRALRRLVFDVPAPMIPADLFPITELIPRRRQWLRQYAFIKSAAPRF